MLDNNIILDYIIKDRKGHFDANRLIELAIADKTLECVSSSCITDIYYIATHSKNENGEKLFNGFEVQKIFEDLFSYIVIIPTDENATKMALRLQWKDFEDAIQYTTAISNNVDIIITNNIKDFENPIIPVITPEEFLNEYLK